MVRPVRGDTDSALVPPAWIVLFLERETDLHPRRAALWEDGAAVAGIAGRGSRRSSAAWSAEPSEYYASGSHGSDEEGSYAGTYEGSEEFEGIEVHGER